MSFKSELRELTGLDDVPAGYQMIGDILVLSRPFPEKVINAVSKLVPRAKTIMVKESGITGEFREPHLRKVWGDGTETIHREHDCLFKMDVTKVMWAKGNVSERKRIASVVRENENVLDMFAGIGYFSIPIAVHNPSAKVVSIEKNPVAFDYLKENIRLNRIKNITPVHGDSKIKALDYRNWADRIIMGYIPEPREFLGSAFGALKGRGVIHYEGIRNKGEEDSLFLPVKEEGERKGYKCTLLHTRIVKSYGPKRNHVVVDVECNN